MHTHPRALTSTRTELRSQPKQITRAKRRRTFVSLLCAFHLPRAVPVRRWGQAVATLGPRCVAQRIVTPHWWPLCALWQQKFQQVAVRQSVRRMLSPMRVHVSRHVLLHSRPRWLRCPHALRRTMRLLSHMATRSRWWRQYKHSCAICTTRCIRLHVRKARRMRQVTHHHKQAAKQANPRAPLSAPTLRKQQHLQPRALKLGCGSAWFQRRSSTRLASCRAGNNSNGHGGRGNQTHLSRVHSDHPWGCRPTPQ